MEWRIWITWSYSISDIQDYFEKILKNNGEKKVKPSVKIYINKIENTITFRIKTGYYLEHLLQKQCNYFEALNVR